MLKHGYAATSVDDICSGAGVTKGSFYHFFENKEDLGLAVLNGFYEQGAVRLASGAYATMNDPHRRLLALFDHLEEIGPVLWRDGCLIGNFACELADSSEKIRLRVAEIFEDLVSRLAPVFQPVAHNRREAAELAEQTIMVIEGAVVMARAHGDPKRISSGLRRFRRTIEGRITESKKPAEKRDQGRALAPASQGRK
jgi:TetR/AcrR family transcriptional repressor of nem operon